MADGYRMTDHTAVLLYCLMLAHVTRANVEEAVGELENTNAPCWYVHNKGLAEYAECVSARLAALNQAGENDD